MKPNCTAEVILLISTTFAWLKILVITTLPANQIEVQRNWETTIMGKTSRVWLINLKERCNNTILFNINLKSLVGLALRY